MSLAADRSVRLARYRLQDEPAWYRSSDWQVSGGALSFSDSRSGRRFEADLERHTLGGEWRTHNLLGGWWCSRTDSESGPGVDILPEPDSGDAEDTRRLIPEVMATPMFPVQAIRAAREGRVVLCFIVEPSGEIREPDFVELSDEVFRAASLAALMRSRYESWDPQRAGGARPACRSFIYRLDAVY
jgi:hypothetical protein